MKFIKPDCKCSEVIEIEFEYATEAAEYVHDWFTLSGTSFKEKYHMATTESKELAAGQRIAMSAARLLVSYLEDKDPFGQKP